MAVPPPPGNPQPPNCPTNYLFEVNGLHYYDTIDCATGTTGWGVSASTVTLVSPPCVDGVCAGVTVTPVIQTFGVQNKPRDESDKGYRPRYPGASATSKRRVKRDLLNFKKRFAVDVELRRRDIGDWLDTHIDHLQENAVHRAYWDYAIREIGRVRLEFDDQLGNLPNKMMVAKDRDLQKETIGNGAIAGLSAGHSIDQTLIKDAVIDQNGGEPNNKYVRVQTKGNPHTPGNIDVFFRLQTVEHSLAGEFKYFLFIGQQIFEADVDMNTALVNNCMFLDRHSHFHTLEVDGVVDPDDPMNTINNVKFFVYSAESLETRESIT